MRGGLSRRTRHYLKEGTIDLGIKDISIDRNVSAEQIRARVLSTLLHEVQHALQQIEGFAQGANVQNEARLFQQRWLDEKTAEEAGQALLPGEGLTDLDRKVLDLDEVHIAERALMNFMRGYDDETASEKSKKLAYNFLKAFTDKAGYELYLRSAGETESRQVQYRQDLDAEARRHEFPFVLPESEANISFGTADYADDRMQATHGLDRFGKPVMDNSGDYAPDDTRIMRALLGGMTPYKRGLERARQLERAKVNADRIERQTGWRRDDLGEWRFKLNRTAAKNLNLESVH